HFLFTAHTQFSTVPIIQNFGLIYKEKFEEWNISQAEYSFMRNLEFAISSCTGLISGALLRKFGFRKISFIGGCLSTISILATSQVTTIGAFTGFYALIGAINTYFKKKRGIATGFAWTITGLSPVLMPQLISLLLGYTDVHGTVLIMAGIALHSLPMALLLQPVKWHGKWIEPEVEDGGDEEAETNEEQQSFLEGQKEIEKPPTNEKMASIKGGQVEGEDEEGNYIVDPQSTFGLDLGGSISRHSSRLSLGSITCPHHRKSEHCKCRDDSKSLEITSESKDSKEESENEAPKSIWKRMISVIVDFFDLTILKDPKFIIIFVGMTLAFAAEVNFVLFFPFVYAEYGYEKSKVALFMSILALVDLVTRFTVPLVTDKMKLDPKLCYAVGMTVLATGRIVLAHADDYNTVLAATIWLGFGKGLRTVFMALVIPSYVPLDRLPTASGLQQLANGVVFLTIGPIFGYLRDITGNYTLLLHCINILSFTAVSLWVLEYLVECCGEKCRKKEENGMKLTVVQESANV
ncbi:hypothetical protein J437_LFUL011792, partial [Ladona fulva]